MEKPQELVSIIVPVYNAGSYLEETIALVQAQTYQNWELILVDDHSSDDGRERIEKCIAAGDKRIRLIARPANKGAADARNTGIQNAGGRYIAFLDADDIWMKDKLERELAFMKEKQAAFVFTAYEFGDEGTFPDGYFYHHGSSGYGQNRAGADSDAQCKKRGYCHMVEAPPERLYRLWAG